MRGSVLYSQYVRCYRSEYGAGGDKLTFLPWSQIGDVQRSTWNRLAKIWKLRVETGVTARISELQSEVKFLRKMRPQRKPLTLTPDQVFATKADSDEDSHLLFPDKETEFRVKEFLH